MGESIADYIGMGVIPQFMYLGAVGIAPKIVDTDGEVPLVEKLIGPRLGECLDDVEKYSRPLGGYVALLGNLGVSHGDLHVNNIIICEGVPKIIDWDHSGAGVIPRAHGESSDALTLLDSIHTHAPAHYSSAKPLFLEGFCLGLGQPVNCDLLARCKEEAMKLGL